MEKVLVIGCPGGGKSTFARNLRDITGLPLFYLDMLWHRPDGTNITREEFDRGLRLLLKEKRWIIDGNYLRTMEIRLKECDTVFLLNYPVKQCLEGAAARVGQKREDMPWVEKELDGEFRRWIEDFPTQQLPIIYELLEKYKEKNIIIFKSRAEANAYIKALEETK